MKPNPARLIIVEELMGVRSGNIMIIGTLVLMTDVFGIWLNNVTNRYIN